MKRTLILGTMFAALLALVSTAQAELVTPEQQAQAQAQELAKISPTVIKSFITPGHYYDSKSGADLYIKAIGSTNYAVIVWKTAFMSIYRIEEVDASTQAWIQLVQGTDNILTNEVEHKPTYAVTQIKTGNDITLKFVFTDYAKTLGPYVQCTIVPTFKFKNDSKQWMAFSQLKDTQFDGSRVRTAAKTVVRTEDERGRALSTPVTEANPKDNLKRNLQVTLTNAGTSDQWNLLVNNLIIESMNGRAFVNKAAGGKMQEPIQFVYNGNFRGEEVIPGLLLVRKRELDMMAPSGLKIEREVSFFALAIEGKMEVMAMPPKARDCAYVRTQLR
jgi:hypothetical protein